MNKIDGLMLKVAKFNKMAKNLKFAQEYNPEDITKLVQNIKDLKTSIVAKIGGSLAGTIAQENLNIFIRNTDPNSAGILLDRLMSDLRMNSKFQKLHTSLLNDSIKLDELVAKLFELQKIQGKRVPFSTTEEVTSIPSTPKKEVTSIPSTPKDNVQSFMSKLNSKVSQLNNVSNNLLSLVAIPGPDSKVKAPLEVAKIDNLVSSLAKDKALLDKGQVWQGTGMSTNQGFLSGLSGEVVDFTLNKIHDAFLKAVDAKTQAISASLTGPTAIDIKKFL